jgi:xanthine dehydrogenase accessory factor
MLFSNHLVVVRGGGDLATGVVYRLHKAGFPVVVLELAQPLVVRRNVAIAAAVQADSAEIEDMLAKRVTTPQEAIDLAQTVNIPVLVAPEMPQFGQKPAIIIDARMAKRNIDTTIDDAALVIVLGPGFVAGVDCDAVIETKRGHSLGRVIWSGAALTNTGTPGIVAGKGAERVLRAPNNGIVQWNAAIGDTVRENAIIGRIETSQIIAPFSGVIRGLIADGTHVKLGLKIGDVDPRADRDACFTISDKALAIGGGVLQAVLEWMNRPI